MTEILKIKMKILIIEDDQYLLNFYKEMKSQVPKEVELIICDSGEEGIAFLEKEMPDLVLLDLLMPETDGYAVLEYLNQSEKIKNTKVYAVTNLDTDEDRTKTKLLGVDKYFVKSDLSHKMFKHMLSTGKAEQ